MPQKIFKDLSPRNSHEHWELDGIKGTEQIKQVIFVQFYHDATFKENSIHFEQEDIIKIIDFANYGEEQIAIIYATKHPMTNEIREFINVYRVHGIRKKK